MLAPYAKDPNKSRGRLYPEKSTPYRNEFERDRDRIIHSNAFKRLLDKLYEPSAAIRANVLYNSSICPLCFQMFPKKSSEIPETID
jgi:hypothetical protein